MRPVILHGHFYQPPREEPWLELVPRERSAAPDHDWNHRITRECYAPLAAVPVLDSIGRVEDVINAYAWCSFDAGATLIRWLESHAPDVVAAMVAGDQASRDRVGHGNAIAAPYHHVILPLASNRDKRTEIRWGIRDFIRRFGHAPLGMWLPETAVDGTTLEILIEEGIRFTILSPHQVVESPPHGGMGRWVGAGGRSLGIFTYDRDLAHDVPFGDLMTDGDRWATAITTGDGEYRALATDGETFGHHRPEGARALGAVIHKLRQDPYHAVTNFATLLPALDEAAVVTVVEASSWSCSHGVERWRMDCGCRFDSHTNQAWRTPLRVGLDVVAQGIHAVVTREWPADAGDPWLVRDAAGPDLDGVPDLPVVARRLLEAERHSLAMFTSCAWFFDDLARIEPQLVLRHAARALEFLPALEADALDLTLRSALAQAWSNEETPRNGATIWQEDVLVTTDGPARLAAGLAALREWDPTLLDRLDIPTHTWELLPDGICTIHRRTGTRTAFRTTPIVTGMVASRVHLRPMEGGGSRVVMMSAYPPAILCLLREGATAEVVAATLPVQHSTRWRHCQLDPETTRRLALEATWALLAREGPERAHGTLQAVLDLWILAELDLPDSVITDAFLHLRDTPPSLARDALADRLGLLLPDPTR